MDLAGVQRLPHPLPAAFRLFSTRCSSTDTGTVISFLYCGMAGLGQRSAIATCPWHLHADRSRSSLNHHTWKGQGLTFITTGAVELRTGRVSSRPDSLDRIRCGVCARGACAPERKRL